MMQQMMQSPMAQAMLSNPELLRGMMTANPQVRQMVSLSLHSPGPLSMICGCCLLIMLQFATIAACLFILLCLCGCWPGILACDHRCLILLLPDCFRQ